MECTETNRRATKTIVALLPQNYPMDQLKPQDIPSYQKALRQVIKKTDEQRIDTPPEFLNHQIKNGGMIVTCAGDYDSWWLGRHIDEVKFKYKLKVDSPIALEDKFLVDGEVTNLENTGDNILHKIRNFNPDIKLTGWKIINEEMNYEKMTRIITFEMPNRSIKCLRRLKNRLRLDEYGVDGINFGTIRPVMKTQSPYERLEPSGSSQQETIFSNTPDDNAKPSTSAKRDIIDSAQAIKRRKINEFIEEGFVDKSDQEKREILKTVLYDFINEGLEKEDSKMRKKNR
ncbi:uncharacterized protein LOC113463930 [Ceratina calcarata]|uniref:Uncharacterized protein LOC113463930 n=1 Tax=Ceratina calcarata TaxID=156304 RepID=A0AAJ7RWF7_9HYME|nr:uncharacterized protein LOC113463930 [Ceratina calcarata]